MCVGGGGRARACLRLFLHLRVGVLGFCACLVEVGILMVGAHAWMPMCTLWMVVSMNTRVRCGIMGRACTWMPMCTFACACAQVGDRHDGGQNAHTAPRYPLEGQPGRPGTSRGNASGWYRRQWLLLLSWVETPNAQRAAMGVPCVLLEAGRGRQATVCPSGGVP